MAFWLSTRSRSPETNHDPVEFIVRRIVVVVAVVVGIVTDSTEDPSKETSPMDEAEAELEELTTLKEMRSPVVVVGEYREAWLAIVPRNSP